MRRPRSISSRTIRKDLTDSIRAGEWWEYKLAPVFAAFYATALIADTAVSTLWRAALTLLLALVPGAAFVSVINDLTDRDEDAAAGKPNRLAGRSRALPLLLVAVTVGMGVVFCFRWRRDTLLLSVYLAAWLAFSLYSLPPFRFKTRGLAGVICDASGAHLFPTLVAVILAFRGAGRPVDALWLASIAVWAFANGVRGILWHQLTDIENDARAGVRTFAQRHAPSMSVRIGTFVAFPLELLALAAIVLQMRSAWPAAFLAVHVLLVWLRARYWRVNAVVVLPKPRFLIVMHEYYDALLPVSVLIASALRHPLDWIVLAAHVAVFPSRLFVALTDMKKLMLERGVALARSIFRRRQA